MTTCALCELPHKLPDDTCKDTQREHMEKLLKMIGDPGVCRGCRAQIVWVTHKNGKKTPYTWAGLNHFIFDCPDREDFKRKAEAQ